MMVTEMPSGASSPARSAAQPYERRLGARVSSQSRAVWRAPPIDETFTISPAATEPLAAEQGLDHHNGPEASLLEQLSDVGIVAFLDGGA